MATGTRRTAPVDWKAVIWAGLISGAVFLIVEMMMVALVMGESMWGPPRMMAAIFLGEGVLPPPATFDLWIVLVAMIVHFPLSVLFTIPPAWFAQRAALALGGALGVGAVWGIALYAVNFYAMTAFFPWFAMARNWVSIVGHIVFGVVAVWAYMALRKQSASVRGASNRADREDRMAAD